MPLLKLKEDSLSDIKENIGRGTSYIWPTYSTNMRIITIIPITIITIDFTINYYYFDYNYAI